MESEMSQPVNSQSVEKVTHGGGRIILDMQEHAAAEHANGQAIC